MFVLIYPIVKQQKWTSFHGFSILIRDLMKGAAMLTRKHHAIAIISIIFTFLLTWLLVNQMMASDATTVPQNETVEEEGENQSKPEVEESLAEDISTVEETTSELETLEQLFSQYRADQSETFQPIESYIQTHFGDQLLEHQSEIVEAIRANHLDMEYMGHIALPKYPAKYGPYASDTQLNVPLYIQKSPEFRHIKYGTDGSGELGENGCAITILAMVKAYFDQKDVNPQEIIDWSQNRFYLHNQGTSWNILHSFAEDFDFQLCNYGNDFYSAMTALDEGEVVIASLGPGAYTDIGHFIIIRGYKNHQVFFNDSNDNPEVMHSIQPHDEQAIIQDALNYWSISK